MLRIGLAGLTMWGAPYQGLNEPGLYVKPDGLQGWDGLSGSRREQVERALAHGDHDTPTFLPSRVVTIDLHILSRTFAELVHDRARVSALGAPGDRMRLVVEEDGLTQWAECRRITAEAPRVRSARPRGSGQIQVVCADPRKYGEKRALPESGLATSIAVFHYGSFDADPVIEIPSAPSAWSVSSPGGTFAISGAPAGGTHRLSLRSGTVTRDGVDITDAVTVVSGDLWAVPAGVEWLHALSAPGRVLITDTYV